MDCCWVHSTWTAQLFFDLTICVHISFTWLDVTTFKQAPMEKRMILTDD